MKVSPFVALRYKDFRNLYLGLLVSRIGSEMQVVAVIWQIYALTRSPLSLGIIGLARFLPVILFSNLAGIASDRFDRKNVMLASQILMMGVSFVLTITTISGHINPLLVYILIAANSVASIFDTPARQSLVPLLVPKAYFINAVSLTTVIWQAAMVIGPAIGGFTIGSYGVAVVYILNLVSFVGVILALLLMKDYKATTTKIVSFTFTSVLEGFQFVFHKPIIYSTMILDFFATFFASATVLLPIFAKEILLVGPQGLGFLYAAPSLGAVVAGTFMTTLGHIKQQGKILLIAVILFGVATVGFGFSQSFYFSLFFLFLTGVGDVISTVIRNTIRQLNTPNHLRGRMISVNMLFFMGGPQLGEMEAGLAAAALGAQPSVILGGIGTIVAAALLAFFVPQLRKYKGDEVVA